jgi:putative PEP-CTERM system histidine kinase
MFALTLSIVTIAIVVLAMAIAYRRSQQRLNLWSLYACLLLLALLEGFDLLSLQFTEQHVIFKTAALSVEALLPCCWLIYAASLPGSSTLRSFSLFQRLLIVAAALLPPQVAYLGFNGIFFSPDFALEKILFVEPAGFYFYLVLIISQITVLFHLEKALALVTPIARRQILYEVLGGLLIISVITLYQSQTLLYRTIDMNLLPARSLAIAVGAFMIGYSRFRRGQGLNMQMSQPMAFRSTAVMVVILYLVALGGIGEGLRYLGLHDRRQVFAIIGVLTGAVLLLFMSSEKWRRKLKVLLHKNFYRQKYDYREEWLKFTSTISSAKSFAAMQEAILSAYCETFARTGAVMYLHDPDSRCYRRVAGQDLNGASDEVAADSMLIKGMIGTDWIYNVHDKHDEEMVETDAQLIAKGIFLCVPLRFEDNLEGFIGLGRAVNPSEVLIFEDYDLMRILASQATSALLSINLSNQLFSAQEMAAIGKVSTFIMHDLKNHVTNLSLVLSNARDYIGDPEFQSEMLENLSGTLVKMKNLILRLQKIGDKTELSMSHCDLLEVARRGTVVAGLPAEIVRGVSVPVYVDREEIEKIVINLLVNAKESGSAVDDLVLEVGSDEQAYFKVSDKGCGMSADFIRENLFKPFKTTKQKGFGIGLYQCRQIVEAHRGRIDVRSVAGEGTTFTVCLLKAAEPELDAEG